MSNLKDTETVCSSAPQNNYPVVLCILDGFGLNPETRGNAVYNARKPNIDKLLKECPNTTLTTFGNAVGLPEGQMGNSEVGHLNIGAGRVVEQWLMRINNALKGNFLDNNKPYQDFIKNIKPGNRLHLFGLLSDGGVHSHIQHLFLLLDRLKQDYLSKIPDSEIYLHLATDGRDTSPNNAVKYVSELQNKIKNHNIKIATITGRFYAMDRDKRWERVKIAVDAIINNTGSNSDDPIAAIRAQYEKGITDEFLEPIIVCNSIKSDDDFILFWNFREDRMRQILAAICSSDFNGFERNFAAYSLKNVLCFTEYDHSIKAPFVFDILEIKNHLGEWLAKNGYSQLRVAETEKYPHVTYFFNGGIEKEYANEDRKLLPSPRDVKTYDQKPEMSAYAVCDTVVNAIHSGKYDLIVVNFANCDMVGHTGVLEAGIKAVETVDSCLGKIIPALESRQGKALIIADHGNAEQMINYETGGPHTAHTTYPVPAILFGCGEIEIVNKDACLKDVAPTLLKMLNLKCPPEMSGTALF